MVTVTFISCTIPEGSEREGASWNKGGMYGYGYIYLLLDPGGEWKRRGFLTEGVVYGYGYS